MHHSACIHQHMPPLLPERLMRTNNNRSVSVFSLDSLKTLEYHTTQTKSVSRTHPRDKGGMLGPSDFVQLLMQYIIRREGGEHEDVSIDDR